MLVTILVFLLILSVLVLIHEAGHFFVAKKLGIKVEEFGFGFPPRVFGKKIGETIYSLNLLPIGGFVKLYGEDDAGGGKIGSVKDFSKIKDKSVQRAFFARPVWQRASVVIAGVVMNFLLSLVIISYLFSAQGVPIPGNQVIIAGVAKNSPAEKAGIKTNDIFVTVNGIKITEPKQVSAITKQHLGQAMDVSVLRNKTIIQHIMITPRLSSPVGQGAMGVEIAQNITIKKYPWYEAPVAGMQELFKETGMILGGLGTLVSEVAIHRTVPKDLAGPVGIAQLTGQVVQNGVYAVLSLVSLLSLNLAVLNILPIPALDGGRLFFIIIEAVTGKKVNQKFESYTHIVGMVLLLTLIALITFHDISRLVHGESLIPKP